MQVFTGCPPNPVFYIQFSPSLNEQTEIWGAKLNNAGQSSTINPATNPELVMSVAGFTQIKKKEGRGATRVVVSIIWCNSIQVASPTHFPTRITRNATQGGPQLFRFLAPSGPLASHPTTLFHLPDKVSAPPWPSPPPHPASCKVSPKLLSSLDYKDLPRHIPKGHIPNSGPWLSLWCPSVRNTPQELGVLICRDAVQPQRASAWQDASEICTTRMPLNLESLITQDFTHWKLFGSIIYMNSHVTIWAHLSP